MRNLNLYCFAISCSMELEVVGAVSQWLERPLRNWTRAQFPCQVIPKSLKKSLAPFLPHGQHEKDSVLKIRQVCSL